MTEPTARDRETARQLMARAPEERVGAIAQALAAAREAGHRSWNKRRLREGRKAKALRGGAAHRPRYGFKTVGAGADAHFEVVPEEMEVRRLIREMYAAGMNSERISEALAAQGRKNRVGGVFQRRQIGRIVSYPQDPAELIARGEMLAEKPKPKGPPAAVGYTPSPKLAPPNPVDVALRAAREAHGGDKLLLAVLTEDDPFAYEQARAALVSAYGEGRLFDLQRELTERIAEAERTA